MIIEKENNSVFIWLTNAESNDTKLMERVTEYCEGLGKKRWEVVVFISGTKDLTECIGDLLVANKSNKKLDKNSVI